MNKLKIFVTGGAGFIGSATAKALIEAGHQVTVFDNLSTGKKEAIPAGAKLIVGDILNQKLLEKVMPGHNAIFHFAALIEAGLSFENPADFYRVNIDGSISLAEAARKTGVKKIIFSSTAAVYRPKNTPLTEEDLKEPENPYGATKLAVENLLAAYHYSYGIESVSLRYFNAYGSWERQSGETHVIPNFIKAVLKGKPVPLYWHGAQVRDFIYIDDLVKAHILALKIKGYNYYNLGTGKGTKISDLLKLVFKICGKVAPIADLGKREGDPQVLLASFDKAKKELGWEPKVTLEEGLKETVDFFKKLSHR